MAILFFIFETQGRRRLRCTAQSSTRLLFCGCSRLGSRVRELVEGSRLLIAQCQSLSAGTLGTLQVEPRSNRPFLVHESLCRSNRPFLVDESLCPDDQTVSQLSRPL